MFDRQFYIQYEEDEIKYNDINFNKFMFNKLIINHSTLISINSCKNEFLEVCALGDIIFPKEPDYSSKDVVEKVLYKCKNIQDVINISNKLSGRYLIIVAVNDKIYFIPDCFALIGIYYAKINNKKIISSNPKLLLNILNESIELNEDYVEFLLNDKSKQLEYEINGYTWFDSRIKKVLPNHYFEMGDFKNYRIDFNFTDTYSEDEIINKGINIIEGTMKACINRYNVIMPITAGLDSRTLLAISRKFRNQIKYYIFSNSPGFYDMDTYIAKKIAKKFNLNFKVIKVDKEFSHEFIDLLKKEQLVLRKIPKIKNIQYHYYNNKNCNIVNLNGNGGEVIKGRKGCFVSNINVENFEQFFNINNINPIFKSEMKAWYEDAHIWSKKYNLNIMDVAYWEQRMGLWGGWYPCEQDIAINEITPFNNRELMMLFMHIDIKERQSPDFRIFKKIILKTWPELLDIPINKHNRVLNKANRIYCKLLNQY